MFYNTWLKRVETEKYDTMLIKGVRKLEKQDSGDVLQPPEFQGGGEERKKCRMVSRGGGLLRGSSALLLEDRGLVLPSLVHIIGEGR